MIGLSISFCVRDIAEGTLCLEDVEKIIAGTRAHTPDDWEKIIQDYRSGYWRDREVEDSGLADRCEKILRELLSAGKIEQPRLLSEHHYPMLYNYKHWVESEDQIIWSDTSHGICL